MNRLLYLSITVFFALLLSVNQGVGIIHLDEDIRLWVQNFWSPSLNQIILAITDFGAEISVFISLLLVVIYFSIKKQGIYIRFYMAALFGAILLFEIIKVIVGRERPESMLVFEPAKSFPSGHATIATVLGWYVYLVFYRKLGSVQQKGLFILCCLYPLLMSYTRVYLNVHYLSDVIAGIALGSLWMIFLSKFYITDET